VARNDRGMREDDPPTEGEERAGEEPLDPLDAREAARVRRRDHDHDAAARDLMRPGMGKVFKQITDSIGRRASRDQKHTRRTARHDS
jgi:hypothetical protein